MGIFALLKRLFCIGSKSNKVESPENPAAAADTTAQHRRRRRPRKPAGDAAATATTAQSAAAPPRKAPLPKAKAVEIGTAGEVSARAILSKKKVGSWQAPPAGDEPGKSYFQNFGLEPEILKAALDDLGFKHCSPIQALALPETMAGHDIAGRAQTGTGKTAVFLMSLLHQFLNSKTERKLNQPFGLVLAPTRELALQIAKDAEQLSVYTSLRTVAVFGGMDYERQRKLLQAGCDLIVATPGRLIDYLKKRVIDTSNLKVLVIDEADRMLDMGFIPDVKRIIYQLPDKYQRQTMLFSATLSRDIMNLASAWMRPEPSVLEVEPEKVVADGINETFYACTADEKLPIMLWILQHEDCGRVIIFRNRRRDVEELHDTLTSYGIRCEMLSGDVNQNRRLNILEEFRKGTLKVVIATDVAARGIQVDEITHVFNFDLPYEPEDYVHRIGRTARAGHKGRAVSFASEDGAFVMPEIEEYIGRALPTIQPENEMLAMPAAVASVEPRRHKPSGNPRQRGEGMGRGGNGRARRPSAAFGSPRPPRRTYHQ